MPLVLFPQGCIYRKRMIYALKAPGAPGMRRTTAIAWLVQAAVAAGLGVSLLPAYARLPGQAVLGRKHGFEAAPATELAIVGEHRGLSMAHRDLIGALEQAIGGSCAV